MNDHMKGIAITTLGILLVTPDTIFVRMITADPMVISFWRGLPRQFFLFCFFKSRARRRATIEFLARRRAPKKLIWVVKKNYSFGLL